MRITVHAFAIDRGATMSFTFIRNAFTGLRIRSAKSNTPPYITQKSNTSSYNLIYTKAIVHTAMIINDTHIAYTQKSY